VTCSALLEEVVRRVPEHTQRVEVAQNDLKGVPPGLVWTRAQIVEHLVLSHDKYLGPMEAAIRAAAPANATDEARTTWLARRIMKAADPDGNVPAPRAVWPSAAPDPDQTLAAWREQQESLVRLAGSAKGKALGRPVVKNPIVGLFRMTLADCFLVILAHTERHVRQVESH